jgi:hypothetical protein
MELRRAYELINGGSPDVGRFYGPAEGFDLGAGIILDGVAYPLFDDREGEFTVVEGRIYLLSHECDIDPINAKPYSNHVVVCPIIPLEDALTEYLNCHTSDEAGAFFGNIGKRIVERLVYIPTISHYLPYGGILYFGSISHTHVDELTSDSVVKCAAVSSYGLRIIDNGIEQAFRKPKATGLPLAGDLTRWREQ